MAQDEKTALICGSVAYDTILVFPDRFKAHILPDKIHILNVSFLVPEMRREFGGCAANIAYSLRLLGDRGLPMATAGHDFGPYRERLRASASASSTSRSSTMRSPRRPSSPPISMTIRSRRFIRAPCSMRTSTRSPDAGEVALGIVAPDGRQAMIEHAAQFAAAGIPFIFDPGPGIADVQRRRS